MKHSFAAGLILTALIIMTVSCSPGGSTACAYDTVFYRPEYASGFEIAGNKGKASRVIRVFSAWQGADSTAMELFIARDGEEPPAGFRGQTIADHAARLAVMSSSYVGMLSCIDACDSVAAVSGKRFISDKSILGRIDSILETGSDSAPDYEGMLARGIDLVLIYGVASRSTMEKRLAHLGIPYLYMGEYLESDPLGRAEWMVALAEIIGDRERGERAFSIIEERYDSLRTMAAAMADCYRPKVMLNAPYGDTWFMASPISAVARMIWDAGGEYVYHGHMTNRSTPVSREDAFMLASEADIWLDTGNIATMKELMRSCPGFSSVKCVRDGMVYNNDARTSPGGGNEYWETSPARPDLVLGDLISILHPDRLTDGDSLYYYRRIE